LTLKKDLPVQLAKPPEPFAAFEGTGDSDDRDSGRDIWRRDLANVVSDFEM
jgi:hypothetical protein